MGTAYNKTDPTNFVDGEVIQASDFTTEFNAIDAAFETGGHQHDGTDGEGGAIEKLLSNTITFGTGADTDIAITFNANTSDGVLTWMEDEDYFQFSDDILLTTTEKIQFGDTASFIQQSSDGVLRIDGEATIDMNASTAVTVSNDLKLDSDSAVLGFGSDNDITLTHAADTSLTLGGAGGTTGLIINNTATDGDPFLAFALSGTQTFTMGIDDGDSDKFKIGTSAIGTSTALTLDSSGNLVISGDLTVTGDDITMGTNTSGNLLIADGSNFNSVAVGSLSEISSVADDDVLLAVDTSGGGLKKITKSTLTAGLATSSGLSNIVEDTSPQLGANLDTNSHNILIDDAHFIADENGNEQIIFQTTSSAVNQFDVTNAATGNAPKLSATGDDSNIDLELEAKGTGHLTVLGNSNSGAIQLNCEVNTHGQILQAQPHSAGVTNTMLLPAGSSSTLVSLVSTDTLTNKTLTTPVINAGADLKNGATSAGFVKFFEDSDNGTNAVTLIGPASTADVTVTLPSSAGTLALTGTSLTIPDAGTIGSASDTDAISISSGGVVDFSQAPTVSSAAIKTAGKETIFVPAAAMSPTASNGCAALATAETTSGRPDMNVLDFDASSDEHAQFQIAFPKSWNEGTVTFQAFWTTAATDTDGVAWGLQGVAVSDNDTIDVAYGTAVVVTDDALGAAEDLCVTAESGAITVAGSPAAGDMCFFRIFRDVSDSNDDMAEDARLIGIKLFFTTDAANDA
tara:strand:- start:1995 stop:4217 length:2223 start_codon:yes stop_codon:yes gene_type:complete